MTGRGKLNKVAIAMLVAILAMFWFAPTEFVEFVLKTLTYHPWRLGGGIAVVLGLYIWLIYTSYFGDNLEESESEPVKRA